MFERLIRSGVFSPKTLAFTGIPHMQSMLTYELTRGFTTRHVHHDTTLCNPARARARTHTDTHTHSLSEAPPVETPRQAVAVARPVRRASAAFCCARRRWSSAMYACSSSSLAALSAAAALLPHASRGGGGSIGVEGGNGGGAAWSIWLA